MRLFSLLAPDLRQTLRLGLPLAGSHLAQMGLHVTDTVMLGWYGVEDLAAVVLGASFWFTVFILGSGFAISVMGLIAGAIGRGEETEARRAARMAMWLSLGYAALVHPAFLEAGAILRALGQDPRIAALAQDYLRIAGLGLAPALLVMVLKSHLAAFERTQVVLWVTIGGLGLNGLLNYALIFGNWGAPQMGLRGAALGSLLTQLVSAVLLALYAARAPGLRRLSLFARFWRPDPAALRRVLRLGLPVGLTGVAEGGLFQASALMMGWVGTLELAAHGIALEITALGFMVHLGLSNAATVRVGHAAGRGDLPGLRRAGLAALLLSGVFALTMMALFLALPEALVRLFLDPADPQRPRIVALGAGLLAVAALFQVADAAQAMALGFLRGVEDTQGPMWIAAVSYWGIGLPASWALGFPLGLGAEGIWYGLVIGLTAAGAALMARFWWRRRGPLV